MTSRIVRRAAALAVVMAFAAGAAQAQAPAPAKSLYQRIGEYDGIVGIVDDFLKQMQADPAFARFGQGRSADSLTRSRQLLILQICGLTGGPCTYIGREMKPVHTGLAITDAEWESSGKKMGVALTNAKVAEADQKEFAAVIEKLRKDIVEKPAAAAAAKP